MRFRLHERTSPRFTRNAVDNHHAQASHTRHDLRDPSASTLNTGRVKRPLPQVLADR
jgi:hypothetical protein